MLPELRPHLTHAGYSPIVVPDDWLVIISQSCDVVQSRLENEPLIEVLHCRPIAQLRPDFQGRKSTRCLDFRPNKDVHAEVVLSAHAIADRYVVPRELFLDFHPDPDRQLLESAVYNLQQWYALRYTRPAWPDAFNSRVDRKTKARLVRSLKLITTDSIEVRIAIAENDEELPGDQPYHISVFFVVDQIEWDGNPEVRAQAHQAYAEFVAALGSCRGIEINEDVSGVKSGDDFSWQATRTTDEWNFANLSES